MLQQNCVYVLVNCFINEDNAGLIGKEAGNSFTVNGMEYSFLCKISYNGILDIKAAWGIQKTQSRTFITTYVQHYTEFLFETISLQ